MKKTILLILGALLAVSTASCTSGNMSASDSAQDDPGYTIELKTSFKTGQVRECEEINFPLSLWEIPETERDDSLDRDGAEGYWIKSLNDTWIFAYVGFPKGASKDNKVPGMMLVHGAGGTAFADWVKMWTDKGYAAMAIAYDASMPVITSNLTNSQYQKSTRAAGPVYNYFADADKPIEEQAVYYGLYSLIAANSFFRSFEALDTDRVGLTGISRGGMYATHIGAYDDRYQCIIPVYGGVTCTAEWNTLGRVFAKASEQVNRLWNSTEILEASNTPTFFINSDSDGTDVRAIARCANACKTGSMLIIPGYQHSHIHGAIIEEIFGYADAYLKGDIPLPYFAGEENNIYEFQLPKGVEIETVIGRYTQKEEPDTSAFWLPVDGDIEGNNIRIEFPSRAAHSYITITDSRGYRMCSSVKTKQ